MLVEVAEAELKTTGGVLLPGSAQKKPTSGELDATVEADLDVSSADAQYVEPSLAG